MEERTSFQNQCLFGSHKMGSNQYGCKNTSLWGFNNAESFQGHTTYCHLRFSGDQFYFKTVHSQSSNGEESSCKPPAILVTNAPNNGSLCFREKSEIGTSTIPRVSMVERPHLPKKNMGGHCPSWIALALMIHK